MVGFVNDFIEGAQYLARHSGAAKLQTIVERLNLSVATVSRALRRILGINPATRAKVFATAAELGYRPAESFRAKDLQSGKLRHIAVLIQIPQVHAAAPFYLVGMSEAAMGLNASLIVHYVNPESCEQLLDSKFQPRAMQSGLVSGVIFVFRWPVEIVREISHHFRAVSIMHRYEGVDMDMIGVDNYEGVDLLLSHLHKLGHRKIGFLGRCADLLWPNQRFGGYVASLTRLGLAYYPGWIIDMDADALTSTQNGAEKFMAEAERLTRTEGVSAWICSTETAGQELQAWMLSRGLWLPEDVSVTGFHRSQSLDPNGLPLTSVTAPIRRWAPPRSNGCFTGFKTRRNPPAIFCLGLA